MTKQTNALDELRDRLLAEPERILEDRDLMRALAAATDRQAGGNVVDLRGVALTRLEKRFARLADTHQGVIAAAYENLTAARMIQDAVLALLEPLDFTEFLTSLGTEIRQILNVDAVRLCLESHGSGDGVHRRLAAEFDHVLGFYEPGSIEEYLTQGRHVASRAVMLRQISTASRTLYGKRADWIRSEALMRFDLGPGKLPGLLALGSEDPHRFHPNQGTDLLAFLGGVFERSMRRWLG